MRSSMIIILSVIAAMVTGIVIVITASVTISTSGNSPAPESREMLTVVTSVAPIASMIRNVGCDRIDLITLVPEGMDSHTFEPTPSDAIRIRDADLVIINGLNLEIPIERMVKAAMQDREIRILKLADNTISRDEWVFDFSFPEEKGDPNPHLWLNVAYAIRYVELISDTLMDIDPENSSYYARNAELYISRLRVLDDGIMRSIQTIPEGHRKLLTYHDSWAYFAKRYGLKVIGAVQPSDFGEPTPQDVARIIEQIREEGVPAIFASEVFPSRVMEQIARETGVSIVELRDDALPGKPGDPNHTYIGMMLENMKSMVIPLGGSIEALEGIDARDVCM